MISDNEKCGIVSSDIMLDSSLSIEARAIYAILACYRETEDGCAYPSIEKLLKDTGISKDRLYKHKNQLEERGIAKKCVRKDGNLRRGNSYYLEDNVNMRLRQSEKNDGAEWIHCTRSLPQQTCNCWIAIKNTIDSYSGKRMEKTSTKEYYTEDVGYFDDGAFEFPADCQDIWGVLGICGNEKFDRISEFEWRSTENTGTGKKPYFIIQNLEISAYHVLPEDYYQED